MRSKLKSIAWIPTLLFVLTACGANIQEDLTVGGPIDELRESAGHSVIESTPDKSDPKKSVVSKHDATMNIQTYENNVWVAKDEEGYAYQVTFQFQDDSSGSLTYLMIDEKSGDVLEKIASASFSLSGSEGTFRFPYNLTKDSFTMEEGYIHLNEESIFVSKLGKDVTLYEKKTP